MTLRESGEMERRFPFSNFIYFYIFSVRVLTLHILFNKRSMDFPISKNIQRGYKVKKSILEKKQCYGVKFSIVLLF